MRRGALDKHDSLDAIDSLSRKKTGMRSTWTIANTALLKTDTHDQGAILALTPSNAADALPLPTAGRVGGSMAVL